MHRPSYHVGNSQKPLYLQAIDDNNDVSSDDIFIKTTQAVKKE